MIETRTNRNVARRRKKSRVPLSKLRTSEAVRTIVAHPSRLEELVRLLDDNDLPLRGRAAATLARLSESHPGRLLRVLDRLKDALADDSAYVRWHVTYALGQIGCAFTARLTHFQQDLTSRLDDENRIVRVIALQALCTLASRKPETVRELFESTKREIPPPIARLVRPSGR